jgi:tetratricopeptide (TPR) repeat protein
MTRCFAPIFFLAAFVLCGFSAGPQPETKKAEDNARAVVKTLRSHIEPPLGKQWDEFQLRVVDEIDKSEIAVTAGWEDWGDEKPTPYIKITHGYLATFGTNPDALALILGRELAPLVLGHVVPKGEPAYKRKDSEPTKLEADADLFAVQLILKSGYSLKKAMNAINSESMKLPEKLGKTWIDRLARMGKIREEVKELWRFMPAFQTGLHFLALEDHPNAILLFDAATREFPASPDAWSLLGCSRLRCYFDQWAKSDGLSRSGYLLGLSHAVHPSNRLTILDRRMWFDAVGSLREANRLKPKRVEVLANLGLAYMSHPDELDLDEAEKYLTAALEALKEQPPPDILTETELLVNLSVLRLAAKKPVAAQTLLDEARVLAAQLPLEARIAVIRAITFNRANAFERDGKLEEAAKQFVRFLEITPRYDPWWPAGYQHYLEVCQSLKIAPKTKENLQQIVPQKLPEVVLPTGKVTVGNEIDDVLTRFGKAKRVTPVCPGSNLKWYRIDAQGIEVLAVENDRVLAVLVVVPKGPVVKIPTQDGKPVIELRVGVSRRTVETMLASPKFAHPSITAQAGLSVYYPVWDLVVFYDGNETDAIVSSILLRSKQEGK